MHMHMHAYAHAHAYACAYVYEYEYVYACAYACAYARSLRGILQQQQRPPAGGDPKRGIPAMRDEHIHAHC